MLGSFLSLNSLDFKSSSNHSLHDCVKIEEETESQIISETEPELVNLIDESVSESVVEIENTTQEDDEIPEQAIKKVFKREPNVETEVPTMSEIVHQFEKKQSGYDVEVQVKSDHTQPEENQPKESDNETDEIIMTTPVTIPVNQQVEETPSDRRKRIRMMLLNSLAGETVTDQVKEQIEKEKAEKEKAEKEEQERQAEINRQAEVTRLAAEAEAAERARLEMEMEREIQQKEAERLAQEEEERKKRRAPRCIADRRGTG